MEFIADQPFQNDVYYQQMFERNAALKLFIDPQDGTIVDANPAAAAFYGYSRAELVSKKIYDVDTLPPDTINDIMKLIITQKLNYFVFRPRLASGSVREVEAYVSPVDMGGKKLIYAILQDVTEPRQAERMLRHRLDLEALTATIAAHFINLKPEDVDLEIDYALEKVGGTLGADHCYINFFGKEPEDSLIIRQSYLWNNSEVELDQEMYIGLSVESFEWMLSSFLNGKSVYLSNIDEVPPEKEHEKAFLKSLGVHSLLAIPLFANDRLIGYFGITSTRPEKICNPEDVQLLTVVGELFTNVIKHRQAEIDLYDSEQRFRSLVEQSLDGVILVNEHGIICGWNRAMERITSIKAEEFMGREYLDLLRMIRVIGTGPVTESRAVGEGVQGKISRDWFMSMPTEYEIILPDGTRHVVEPLPFIIDRAGGFMGCAMVRDITQRKESEARLRRQVEEFRVLNTIATAGAEANDEGSLIKLAIQLINDILYPERVKVLMLDEPDGVLRGHVVYESRGMDNSPYYQPYRGSPAEPGIPYFPVETEILSALWMPIKAEQRLLGIIVVKSRQMNEFTEGDEKLLKALAGQLATAIVKIRLLEQTGRRAREMGAIVNISSALRRSDTTGKMIDVLISEIAGTFNASDVSLFLLDNEELVLAGAFNPARGVVGSRYMLQADDPVRPLLSRAQPFVMTADSREHYSGSDFLQQITGLRVGVILVPLVPANVPLGLLLIARQNKSLELSEEEGKLLSAITDIAGNALRRATVMDTLEQRVAERTRHLTALYDISKIANEQSDLQVVMENLLDRALDVMNSKSGFIHLLDKERQALVMTAHRGVPVEYIAVIQNIPLKTDQWNLSEDFAGHIEPIFVPDMSTDERVPASFRTTLFRSYIGMPLRAKGEILGMFNIIGSEHVSLSDVGLLEMIAEQIGLAVYSNRLRKQAEELAVLKERNRLARDLHDSVTQSLYSINLMVKAAHRFADMGKFDRCSYYLDELADSTLQALKEMRLFIYELHSPALGDQGLWEALRQRLETVEQRTGVSYHLAGAVTTETAAEVQESLYWIAVEALNNVLKHANATDVTVTLQVNEGGVLLEIADNGSGFDLETARNTGGLGLKTMRERAEKLGGELIISSIITKGTVVRVKVGG